MTLNIMILNHDFVICASDKRLSAPNGSVLTERSTKMTAFQCYDAKGFIVYTGIGWDQTRKTPSDWILEDPDLPKLKIDNLVKRLKNIADQKIGSLPSVYTDRRHTFTIGCLLSVPFVPPMPVLYQMSNFDFLDAGKTAQLPNNALSIESLYPPDWNPLTPCRSVIANGSTSSEMKKKIDEIGKELKNGAAISRLKALAKKFIRDGAYKDDRKGTIGSTVDIGVLHKDWSIDFCASVVGGTLVHEGINIITPSMKMTDIYIHGGSNGLGFLGCNSVTKRGNLKESNCRFCQNPMPKGHRQCGKCGGPAASLK